MKMGIWKDQLADSLQEADLIYCYTHHAEWNVEEALSTLGKKAHLYGELMPMVDAITLATLPGDHIVIMSNGGFEGIHEKLQISLSKHHH